MASFIDQAGIGEFLDFTPVQPRFQEIICFIRTSSGSGGELMLTCDS